MGVETTTPFFPSGGFMEKTVYCIVFTEPQANAILTHLRNLGFSASEVSILLKQTETRNISVKEDVIRGAKKGGLAGGVLGTLATVLTVPALGPLVVAGPIVSALGGAAAGGVIGALAGGSGALTHIGIPKHLSAKLEQKLHDGAILIAVHSSNPARLDRAVRVFKSEAAEEIYGAEDLAA
jgi:hypothetical protein